MWECLNKAHNSQQKSICFPAIGTGLLGYDKDVVARVMMEGAVAFAQQTNGVHLDISYLMYPTDTNTYKVSFGTKHVSIARTYYYYYYSCNIFFLPL